MKKDSKFIGSAIVNGVGQVVDPYQLSPENSDTKNSTATPPVSDKPSVSPEGSPESKSAKPSDAFRFKGRIDNPVTAGKRPATDKPKPATPSFKWFSKKSDSSPPPLSSTPPPPPSSTAQEDEDKITSQQ